MPNLAHIQIIGHIGKLSDLSFLASGSAVLKFSLAVNTGYDKNKRTTWYECVQFGKRAESVHKFLAKGKAIMVIGEVSQREWTSEKTGKTGVSLEVVADSIVLLGDNKREESPQQEDTREQQRARPEHTEAHQEPVQEEIPF
jgi:single-strand DNA-binding protein